MRGISIEDLPPALRAQVLDKPQVSRAKRESTDPGLPLTCTTCGEVIHPATTGRINRHGDTTGHSRLEWRP